MSHSPAKVGIEMKVARPALATMPLTSEAPQAITPPHFLHVAGYKPAATILRNADGLGRSSWTILVGSIFLLRAMYTTR